MSQQDLKSVKLLDSLSDFLEESKTDEQLIMGLDCSTQSFTINVYNTKMDLKHSVNINFDRDLPEFNTSYGVHKYIKGTKSKELEDKYSLIGQVRVPTLMFIKALDLGLKKLKNEKCNFNNIITLSGSGQQHGTVYWSYKSKSVLKNMENNWDLDLYQIFKDCFSLSEGPIWMDSSTQKQCDELEEKIGGIKELVNITGCKAYCRFSGNQINKMYKLNNNIYKNTYKISLISSFLGSIFIGNYSNIDLSDGSGMNLLDINNKNWNNKCLNICGGNELINKLGNKLNISYNFIGNINNYFVKKYNFNKNCVIISFSGDNPCSLVGLQLSNEGDIGISLGTSDTVFCLSSNIKPSSNYGFILYSPINSNNYMLMNVYRNGSIIREEIRNNCFKNINENNIKWNKFNKILNNTPIGNNGIIGLYYLQNEITPNIKSGIYRFDKNNKLISLNNNNSFNSTIDIRGIIESQFLGMKSHLIYIGVKKFNRIICTGGASKNKYILQILCDIFGRNVYTVKSGPDTATKGAALRAFHGYKCYKNKKFIPFDNICKEIGVDYVKVCSPNMNNHKLYEKMRKRRDILEQKLYQSQLN